MLRLPLSFFWWFAAFIRSRHEVALELVALRQQLIVLKRKNPRPRLSQRDRVFWVALRHFWSRWAEALIVIKPETVVSWHRAGFRHYSSLGSVFVQGIVNTALMVIMDVPWALLIVVEVRPASASAIRPPSHR